MTHAEPTETDRLAARAALKLGVLRLYDEGLGYVSPSLCGLSGRELDHAKKAARHTLDHWPQVTLAARRLIASAPFRQAA